MEKSKPFVWQMIKEAVAQLGGRGTYSEIKNYINGKWDNVNESTINAQILVLTVNQPSRIHYPENKKPRLTNSSSNYDVLFSVGRGLVVTYNVEEHGVWEIYKNEFDGLGIRQIVNDESQTEESNEENNSFLFPIEANLRDFLIQNLHTIKNSKLKLFTDNDKRDGKEYPTGVGPIDILTIDDQGNYVVFELKLSRGADRALGQLLRYMGWVKKNLAIDKSVRGIIVANKMDEKIKYAVTVTPDVALYEYEMKFELTKIVSE
jgi:RecB family endonuclease NucS